MTTTEKTCFKCKMVKSMNAFYRHSKMGDGHLNKCIECTKKDVAEHRESNIEKVRAYDRERAKEPHRVELRYKIIRRWQAEHPERKRAAGQLSKAVSKGLVAKPPCCTYCGSGGRIEAHHPDYSRPLDVVWLCVPCHRRTHAMTKMMERIAA